MTPDPVFMKCAICKQTFEVPRGIGTFTCVKCTDNKRLTGFDKLTIHDTGPIVDITHNPPKRNYDHRFQEGKSHVSSDSKSSGATGSGSRSNHSAGKDHGISPDSFLLVLALVAIGAWILWLGR